MTTRPLVTFGVPAYNHEKYIVECLSRIADEPYEPKELVVIDDGSTDGTAGVIERWVAENGARIPTRFITRPNVGLARTLNQIIAETRGRYLRLCASDDYLLPGTLESLVDTLERNPRKRMVIGDARVIDEAGRTIAESATFDYYRGRKKNYFHDAGLKQEVIYRWSVAGGVQLARADLYQEVGGYSEELKIEDWDFMLRVIARDYLVFVDRIVAAYRVHGQNTFNSHYRKEPLKSEREYLAVLEKNHALFRGLIRRRIDYMLFKQRALVRHMEIHGVGPSKREMFGFRRRAFFQAWGALMKRAIHGN